MRYLTISIMSYTLTIVVSGKHCLITSIGQLWIHMAVTVITSVFSVTYREFTAPVTVDLMPLISSIPTLQIWCDCPTNHVRAYRLTKSE